MMTSMEKRTCNAPKLAQRCRNLEERIRQQLQQAALLHNARVLKTGKGEWSGRVDSVWVGSDVMSVTGDRFIAETAAKLFRESGLLNVEVYEHCSKAGTWIASGATR